MSHNVKLLEEEELERNLAFGGILEKVLNAKE